MQRAVASLPQMLPNTAALLSPCPPLKSAPLLVSPSPTTLDHCAGGLQSG